MKKHNEGYTLVLVMFVLVLLCILGTFIISFAARNLQTQVTAVSQMKDKYQAQAEIEKIVGSLEALIGSAEEGTVELKSIEDKVEIEVLADKQIKITSSYGTARVYCTLKLTCDAITGTGDSYTISGLSDVSCAAYQYTISGGGGNEENA